ncbi:MAG: tetratricopeptide repeat protein [Vicinamibacterales bacterium]
MNLATPTGAGGTRQPAHRLSEVLGLYPLVREEHLKTLQKCSLVEPPDIVGGERFVRFADVAVIRQVNAELQRGAPFRAILRSFIASQSGQLVLDFQVDRQPAKVLSLGRPSTPAPGRVKPGPPARPVAETVPADGAAAEQYFALGSSLDDGAAERRDDAAAAYRRALEIDPRLVPALINLANIHYSQEHLVEAMALYERAIILEPDVFEGYFNLGNIHHDLGRYRAAEEYYLHALAVNPRYPDAHLYLAVALEKDGRSDEAKPHWRAYHAMAPDGEWAELAREFSD